MRQRVLIMLAAILVPGGCNSGEGSDELSRDYPPTDQSGYLPTDFIALACNSPGTHQDVAKTPRITNTTEYLLPGSHNISWTSDDGDGGIIELQQPLAPGKTVDAAGKKPGQTYSCFAVTSKP